MGRSAVELLTDIRMSLAANELKKPAMTTEAVADSIGYRSEAAFRRVFADRMRMTPGNGAVWRARGC
jgi:AraC family transcriptional activator of mtrCDE